MLTAGIGASLLGVGFCASVSEEFIVEDTELGIFTESATCPGTMPCHAMLLTGLDLYTTPDHDKGSSGIAYLSCMCSSQGSFTISEARSLGSTTLIVAHELAHNVWVDHDGQGSNIECDSDDYIMGPKLSPGAT